MTDLYFCCGDNRRFAEIAIEAGILYGARLPARLHYPIVFADQDWQKPNRAAYMAALRQHRPHMATVLDLERYEQLEDVLEWAEEAASIVNVVVIIPKFHNVIPLIPTSIGGSEVRLGAPCGPYSGKRPAVWEFGDRPVHLLGGSPHAQRTLAMYLNVVSVDCSMTASMARRKAAYWSPERVHGSHSRHWVQLKEIGLGHVCDAPYEAFTRSCQNLINLWRRP